MEFKRTTLTRHPVSPVGIPVRYKKCVPFLKIGAACIGHLLLQKIFGSRFSQGRRMHGIKRLWLSVCINPFSASNVNLHNSQLKCLCQLKQFGILENAFALLLLIVKKYSSHVCMIIMKLQPAISALALHKDWKEMNRQLTVYLSECNKICPQSPDCFLNGHINFVHSTDSLVKRLWL